MKVLICVLALVCLSRADGGGGGTVYGPPPPPAGGAVNVAKAVDVTVPEANLVGGGSQVVGQVGGVPDLKVIKVYRGQGGSAAPINVLQVIEGGGFEGGNGGAVTGHGGIYGGSHQAEIKLGSGSGGHGGGHFLIETPNK